MMVSQKVVTPVETGVQRIYNYLKRLDSGFRRNDSKTHFPTFYEIINYTSPTIPHPPLDLPLRGVVPYGTESLERGEGSDFLPLQG